MLLLDDQGVGCERDVTGSKASSIAHWTSPPAGIAGDDGAFTRLRIASQSGVALRLPPHSIALGSRKTTAIWSAPAERKRRRRFDFVS
jgi:hypothetical protein